jgi:hypothetical protein
MCGPLIVNVGRDRLKLRIVSQCGLKLEYVPRARACARHGVLVVGEEMKGLVNCKFLPGGV